MIKLFNLIDFKQLKDLENNIEKVICIGNTNTYYKYKKGQIQNLKYIPFKNLVVFYENEKYKQIVMELYRYASMNGIEVEIYEDIEEFVECVNADNKLDSIVVFTDNEEQEKKVTDEIKAGKLFINRNPFKEESFKVDL